MYPLLLYNKWSIWWWVAIRIFIYTTLYFCKSEIQAWHEIQIQHVTPWWPETWKLGPRSPCSLVRQLVLAGSWGTGWGLQPQHASMGSPCILGFSQHGSFPGLEFQERARQKSHYFQCCAVSLLLSGCKVSVIEPSGLSNSVSMKV